MTTLSIPPVQFGRLADESDRKKLERIVGQSIDSKLCFFQTSCMPGREEAERQELEEDAVLLAAYVRNQYEDNNPAIKQDQAAYYIVQTPSPQVAQTIHINYKPENYLDRCKFEIWRALGEIFDAKPDETLNRLKAAALWLQAALWTHPEAKAYAFSDDTVAIRYPLTGMSTAGKIKGAALREAGLM